VNSDTFLPLSWVLSNDIGYGLGLPDAVG
jgi:hypothetical protein